MDASTTRSVKQFARVAAVLAQLPRIGADEYANGRFRKTPIVDRHFTPGNQGRYGWPDLSPEYEEDKQGKSKALRKGMKAAGRVVSKLDEDRFGSGILPMLVRSGRMRQAVTSRTHRIEHQGDVAIAVFMNLPVFALAHHTGAGALPKRSPVEPNIEDREAVVAVMRKQLDLAIGTGGSVPISASAIPDRARFV